MNIDDYSAVIYWLEHNEMREAKCYKEYLPEPNELKDAIRNGGVKVERVRERIGKYSMDHFLLKKSHSFHFEWETHKYTY